MDILLILTALALFPLGVLLYRYSWFRSKDESNAGMMTFRSIVPSALLRSSIYVRHRFRPRFYSQDGEDEIVARSLGPVKFFIDIGANDGITHSNTFRFALTGARGVCFEPASAPFKRLRSLYRLSRRVVCRNCAISDHAGETEMVTPDANGLSHIPETADTNHQAIHAPYFAGAGREAITLLPFKDAIAGLVLPETVDLLSIDVEGHELNVLRSIPFDEYRFRAIIVETHIRDEWRHRDYDAILRLLGEWGYQPHTHTQFNAIFTQGPQRRATM